MSRFTHQLWSAIEPIYAKTLAHPFLQGMANGRLDEKAFRHYVVQDALYLRDFARGLAVLGAKSDSDDDLMMFCEHAKVGIVVERSLHEGFFATWGMKPADVYTTPKAPNCLLYTSYLMRVAYERPVYEGLGAFLPCYWIYLEVGKALEKLGSPHPIYQQWIDTYASEQFAGVVNAVKETTDRVADTLTDAQRQATLEHFVMTAKFEHYFWDMGYTMQSWMV